MNKMYVIQWKSKVNGRAGRGTKMFGREEAEQLARELNEEYPDIFHEPINLEGRLPAPVPPETAEPVKEPAPAEPEPQPAEKSADILSFKA